MLKKKIGKVDLLLNNYNHAGKLLEYPLASKENIHLELKERFFNTIKAFYPRYTIPFASSHYYRAKETTDQNTSLMDVGDLLNITKSLIPLNIGDKVLFKDNLIDYNIIPFEKIYLNQIDIKIRKKSYNLKLLKKAFTEFTKKINLNFFYMTFWIPTIRIYVEDLNKIILLKIFKKQVSTDSLSKEWHITATSSELYSWWSTPYGTDSFWIGGHFKIDSINTVGLRMILLLGLLIENRLDMRNLLTMVFNPKGLLFFYNRREEIYSILFSRNFMFGPRK